MRNLKNRNLFVSFAVALCLAVTSMAGTVPVMADGMKVVTLGADLTQAQKDTMMRYFKVDENEVQILTITNADEREHLSAYVPLEQIGTRTVSCSYVKPTNSGGIKVRTTNLNWVTCNMIATTLSTSGISNCEVVAACPFEVSGTGALTGIIMAYEAASGEELDEEKKELATEELVVTGDLAQNVGQNDATNVINEAKMEIIDSGINSADEIYNIVVNVAERNGVMLEAEQLDRIVALLEEIAQQNYDYEAMRETLENVEDNLTPQEENEDTTPPEEEETPSETPEETPEVTEEPQPEDDSILDDLDEDILGDDVITESTEDPTPQEEVTPEDLLNTDDLSDEDRELFEQAEQFCEGEFKDNPNVEQYDIKLQGPASLIVLSFDEADEVTQRFLETFIGILRDGGESYTPTDSDTYLIPELNMLEQQLPEVFDLNPESEEVDDFWVNYSVEDRTALFDDSMTFFENLYGETTETTDGKPETVIPDPIEEETPDDQDWAWLETKPEDMTEVVPPDEQTPEEQIPEEQIPDEQTPEEQPGEETPEQPQEEVTPEEQLPEDQQPEDQQTEELPPEETAPPVDEYETLDEQTIAERLNADDLSPEDSELFESARSYCAGEFDGNTESEQYAVKLEGPAAEVVMSAEDSKELTERVLLAYIEVLRDDGQSYVPADDDAYLDPELNVLEDSLIEIFKQPDPSAEEEVEPIEITEGLWQNYTEEDRKALFDDTITFFEKLYGEYIEEFTMEELTAE